MVFHSTTSRWWFHHCQSRVQWKGGDAKGVLIQKFSSGVFFFLLCVAGGLLVVIRHINCSSMYQIIIYSLLIAEQFQLWFGKALKTSFWVQLVFSGVCNGVNILNTWAHVMHVMHIVIITVIVIWWWEFSQDWYRCENSSASTAKGQWCLLRRLCYSSASSGYSAARCHRSWGVPFGHLSVMSSSHGVLHLIVHVNFNVI